MDKLKLVLKYIPISFLLQPRLLKFLRLTLKYSFILWIPIIFWNGYSFYKSYAVLLKKENKLKSLLDEKRKTTMQTKYRLEDIKNSYITLRKFFSAKQVRKIKKTLDTLVAKVKNEESKNLENALIPLRVETFNIPRIFSIDKTLFSQEYTISDIHFRADCYKIFYEYLRSLLIKAKTNQAIYVNVRAINRGNYIVLYPYQDSNGFLKLYPISEYGFISNVYRYPYILTSTVLTSEALESGKMFSSIYFGWELSPRKEGR